MQYLLDIAIGFSAVAVAIFAAVQLYKLLLPIHIQPIANLSFANKDEDEIRAIITNRSTDTQYITYCSARGMHSLLHIAKTHITHPFINPRLYKNFWFTGVSFDLIDNEPVEIHKSQPIELKRHFFDHPLSALHAPFFIVEINLSSGRLIRSKKIPTPLRWRKLRSAEGN
ncbi:hypothetical protein [Pseudomonas sp.]|uniref:hypothetical protein n=1 Tax=Pseudomonas sp. TaxID=306 RepID=UPI00299DBF1C|nr:hypothetical protein [Pseudomonas sp.]MDX1370223.1 hypothetical protein [Pseudomonas sp.]